MKNRLKIATVCALVLGSLGFVGCSEAVDEITNTVNCRSVCERYSECIDSDYDVDGCTDRCEGEADASEDREAKLEACENCIDDRSCATATFACAAECGGIVP
jgi:hypothetical protein